MTDTGTRQRILATAATLFRRQGYSATGLRQVIDTGGAPKGTLYHHFPGGKEQLGIESVQLGAVQTQAVLEEVLAAADGPRAAVDRAVDLFAAGLLASDFREGCPVAPVALEAATGSELLRRACADAYRSWTSVIVAAFARWGVPEDRREDLAVVVLSAIEGAVLLSRVERDVAPLRAVAGHIGALIASSATVTD